MKINVKLVIVCLIAAAAITVAIRSFIRSGEQSARPTEALPRVAPSVKEQASRVGLSEETLDTVPTPDNLDSVTAEFEAQVQAAAATRGIPATRLEDLGDAVSERLLALIARDPARDREAWLARGSAGWESPPDGLTPADEEIMRHYGYAPMALDRVDAVPMIESGRETDSAWSDVSSLGSLTSTVKIGPRKLAVPEDIRSSKADIVEVRLPMQVKRFDGQDVVALMAFGMLWHDGQKQWLPIYNRIYFEQGGRFVSPMM